MKRLICLLFGLLLIFGCTGCSGGEAETTVTPAAQDETTRPAVEPDDTSEPATTATEPTTIPTEPQLVLHSGLKEDGSFGPASVAALKAWQTKYGLDADGSYGPKSYKKMLSLLQ